MSRSLGVPWHPSLTLRRPPAQAASLGRPAWVRRLAHVLTITMNEVARQTLQVGSVTLHGQAALDQTLKQKLAAGLLFRVEALVFAG
jgi:hypothetical protein